MALSVPNPPTTPRRVKVYELRNNDWFDRGTGYCTGQLVNDEPHIQVKSEEEQDRMLLETKIIKDDGYQKQQETLIVWTEPHGTDMALSFQEAEGCAAIWEFVSHVQSHLLSIPGADEILSDDANESLINSVMLPSPELGNLTEIEAMIRSASSSAQARDSLGKFVLSEDFIRKLIPLLEMAEDLESLENLHRLCNIMKMIILLNDTLIIEHIVTDEVIFGVVGMLEYDPDFPNHKANHRQFLSDTSKFKEVVPIKDPEIKRKIHWTYRLQYLKDVVLARILDDPTFSVLNSLIFFNQVDILQHLQSNQAFLKELFSIFHSAESAPVQKRNGVLFIQQCCSIAKSLQGPVRTQLYNHFIQNGLFAVIDFALLHGDPSVRIAGTETLVAMIDHDPTMMRALIFRQISDKQKPLTDTLIELLLGEQDLGVKAQIADAIRVLLDPSTGPQTDGLGKTFYDESAKKLFLPLTELNQRATLEGLSMAEVSLFSHLIETLCFFIRQHAFRGKYFLLAENLPSRIAQLLSSSEKHLKLTALKFFRTCVGLQDEFYTRHMIKWGLFEPILGLVIETMPRNNLLNSACLEFFEFIKKENLKPIILHLVEHYRDRMKEITYVDTFSMLILKSDQLLDRTLPSSCTQGDDNLTRNHVNGARRWQGVKDMDPTEEEYFNTSDEEEDNAPTPRDSPIKAVNGSPSPQLKPLVDYPDDDAMDTADEVKSEEKEDAISLTKTEPGNNSTASPVSSPTTPTLQKPTDGQMLSGAPMPERLAEKRRREEEDDDELGKLSLNKRRGPTGGGSVSLLNKKRSLGPSGTLPNKKIAINLAIKTSGNTDNGGGGGGGGGGGEEGNK